MSIFVFIRTSVHCVWCHIRRWFVNTSDLELPYIYLVEVVETEEHSQGVIVIIP